MKKFLLAILLLLSPVAVLAQQGNQVIPTGSSSTVTSGKNIMSLTQGIVSCLDVTPACVTDYSVLDASLTSSSPIVTCPNSDCHFLTTAAIGQVFQCGDTTNGIDITTTTILSVDSDTQIHANANSAHSQTATAYCAWGVDNTASMDALQAASVQVCKYGFIPAGFYLTSHPDFNTANANCAYQNAGRVGGIIGAGPTWLDTKILLLYTLSYASCTGGSGSNVCFFGVLAQDDRAIAIDTMYNSTNPGSSKYIAENNAGYWDRIGISGLPGAAALSKTPNLTMTHFAGTESVTRESASVGGANACVSDGLGVQFTINPCLQGGFSGLFVNSGNLHSFGTYYGGGTAAVYCAAGAICYHNNDTTQLGPFYNLGTSYYDTVFSVNSGTGFSNQSGGVMVIRNNTHNATSNAMAVANASGGTVVDAGGNTGIGAVTNSGIWNGDLSITGTVLATGNVAISTCGTSAATLFSGMSRKGQFTITFAGTPGTACTATVTFPNPFLGTIPICTWSDVGGTNAVATSIVNGTTNLTSTAVTIGGPTFTNGNTEIMQYQCSNP